MKLPAIIPKSTLVILTTLIASTAFSNDDKNAHKVTEVWSPIPKKIDIGSIPSDAIPLLQFDDKSIHKHWHHPDGKPAAWHYHNGILTVEPTTGSIITKERFCDIQMHLEWRSPKSPGPNNHSNSGIKIQKRYEVQILDTYGHDIYVNGQAGSIYKQSAPLVNAEKNSGEWQSYDIIFKAPKFDDAGQIAEVATVTVLLNGVLVQNNFEILGTTLYVGTPDYPSAHGCEPILLQDHGDRVSFRNIWVRKL